jgi:hypothetical protein
MDQVTQTPSGFLTNRSGSWKGVWRELAANSSQPDFNSDRVKQVMNQRLRRNR